MNANEPRACRSEIRWICFSAKTERISQGKANFITARSMLCTVCRPVMKLMDSTEGNMKFGLLSARYGTIEIEIYLL